MDLLPAVAGGAGGGFRRPIWWIRSLQPKTASSISICLFFWVGGASAFCLPFNSATSAKSTLHFRSMLFPVLHFLVCSFSRTRRQIRLRQHLYLGVVPLTFPISQSALLYDAPRSGQKIFRDGLDAEPRPCADPGHQPRFHV